MTHAMTLKFCLVVTTPDQAAVPNGDPSLSKKPVVLRVFSNTVRVTVSQLETAYDERRHEESDSPDIVIIVPSEGDAVSRRRCTYVRLPLDYAGNEGECGKRTPRPLGDVY